MRHICGHGAVSTLTAGSQTLLQANMSIFGCDDPTLFHIMDGIGLIDWKLS
jgi:hypothetical protein